MDQTGGRAAVASNLPQMEVATTQVIAQKTGSEFDNAKKFIYDETDNLYKEYLSYRQFNQYEKYGAMFRSIWAEYKKLSSKSMNLYTFIAINNIVKPIQSSKPIEKNEYELSLPAGIHTDWTRPDDAYINNSFHLWLAMIIENYNTQR